ncbi:MAG: DUF2795 domain-containing protein [Armatimonadetes bacterium]|jgi:hypothetical protein|nr:DUF2795 domain-containing protein [Armatimonadota bacterium]
MNAQVSTRTNAQLAAYFDDIVFPCSRMEILRCAEDNEAPDVLLDAIEDLPEQLYNSMTEVLISLVYRAS